MHRRRIAVLGAFVALVLSIPAAHAAAAAAPAAPTADASASPALDDAAKREIALDVLERFAPHAEAYWRASDLGEPSTGRYDAPGSGVTQPRGAGGIAFAYVTLLAGRPDQQSFGGVSRETMIDHTIQSIRHEALTNKLSGAGYDRWGGGTWQASLETYLWAFAAHRLWDRLDEDTRGLVRRVVTGEADILVTKPIASGEDGDTGAEDNGWNAPTPALAAVMFPDAPNRAAWERATQRLAMNASSVRADASNETLVDGVPVRDWMASVNLHPDLTMENHGFFNPIYQQVAHETIDVAAIFYGAARHPLPEALSFRTEQIWNQVLGRLATDDGDFAMPAGQDWISKDYQHLAYLSVLATRFKRADASVLESRALQLVARRQATHDDGSLLGQPQVGYETMLIERMAELWWNHTLFGPSAQPSAEQYADARAQLAGVKSFPYSDFIAGRLGDAFASMSWDQARPLALLVPHGDATPDDPIFSYYAPKNLLGPVSGAVGAHTCACADDRFSTAGSIGTRRFSMTAFPDGTTLLLDRGSGATFTYAIEDIAGLTGERPIWSASGSGLGDLSGSWVDAADRLGMVVRGGSGIRAVRAGGTNPTIAITGSTDTGSGNRGAALLPLVDHERTAALEPFVTQPATPDDWSALAARAADGSVRLAVARWGGPSSATLELSDERGAPVPEQDARLDGTTARFDVALDLPASRGQTLRFLASSSAPLRGHQDGERRAVLRNPGDTPADVAVTYVPTDGGAPQVVHRTLAAGEQVVARLLDGRLTLAGPELEPLLEARATLAGLVERLRGWQRDGRLSVGQAAALIAPAGAAIHALDDGIAQARATTPDTRRAAAAVTLARSLVGQLDPIAQRVGVPADMRAAVAEASTSARGALDRALGEAYTVVTRAEADGPARPGEPLTVRVTMLNRGLAAAVSGTVEVSGPDGWSGGSADAFEVLEPGATRVVTVTVTPPADAQTGTTAELHAELSYRRGAQQRTEETSTSVAVAPVVELAPATAKLPVVPGTTRPVQLHVRNLVDRPVSVTLSATAPDGAAAEPAEPQLTLPASGSADVTVHVTGTDRTSGSGTLQLAATTAAGARSTADVELRFSDDLARNGVGAPVPAATASSAQEAFPAGLAFDGDAATFWVSAGTKAGEGPTPTRPQWLAVDLGTAAQVGSVTMTPRTNYGPKAYAIEVSADGQSWQRVASVAAPNARTTTTFAPVSANWVRLLITDGWDGVRPPRNVQVVGVEVRAG